MPHLWPALLSLLLLTSGCVDEAANMTVTVHATMQGAWQPTRMFLEVGSRWLDVGRPARLALIDLPSQRLVQLSEAAEYGVIPESASAPSWLVDVDGTRLDITPVRLDGTVQKTQHLTLSNPMAESVWLANARSLVGFGRGRLVRVDVNSGRLLLDTTDRVEGFWMDNRLIGERMLRPSENALRVIDLRTGDQAGEHRDVFGEHSFGVMPDESAYFTLTGDAIERRAPDGTTVWQQKLEKPPEGPYGRQVLVSDSFVAVIVERQNELWVQAFHTADGQRLAPLTLEPRYSQVSLAGQHLKYYSEVHRSVVVCDLLTGKVQALHHGSFRENYQGRHEFAYSSTLGHLVLVHDHGLHVYPL